MKETIVLTQNNIQERLLRLFKINEPIVSFDLTIEPTCVVLSVDRYKGDQQGKVAVNDWDGTPRIYNNTRTLFINNEKQCELLELLLQLFGLEQMPLIRTMNISISAEEPVVNITTEQYAKVSMEPDINLENKIIELIETEIE